MSKKLVIITKYFFPSQATESKVVCRMLAGLRKINNNLSVHIVTTDSYYKGEIPNYEQELNAIEGVKIHRILSMEARVSSMPAKFLGNLIDGYRLVKKAKSLNIKNIISLTNPMFIGLWCSLLLKKKNFFYWTFDLYPEVLAAGSIFSKKSLTFKILDKLTYKNKPKVLISLGELQYKYLCQKFNSNITSIILPAGIHDNDPGDGSLPTWISQEPSHKPIIIGYIGNLGRAHSILFLKNIVTAIKNKDQFKLILSLYGFHKLAICDHIKKSAPSNVLMVDALEQAHFGLIDIHLVSLKSSWDHISIPSKAVSAVCAESALWYCGSEETDTWAMFHTCSYKSTEDIEGIQKTLTMINKSDLQEKKTRASIFRHELYKLETSAYESIVTNIS